MDASAAPLPVCSAAMPAGSTATVDKSCAAACDEAGAVVIESAADLTATVFRAYPSVAVNSQGDVLMGYSEFSSTIYASAYYTYRTPSDAPNTISLGVAFGDDIAASDLPEGTELTTNYFEICDAVRSRGSI